MAQVTVKYYLSDKSYGFTTHPKIGHIPRRSAHSLGLDGSCWRRSTRQHTSNRLLAIGRQGRHPVPTNFDITRSEPPSLGQRGTWSSRSTSNHGSVAPPQAGYPQLLRY